VQNFCNVLAARRRGGRSSLCECVGWRKKYARNQDCQRKKRGAKGLQNHTKMLSGLNRHGTIERKPKSNGLPSDLKLIARRTRPVARHYLQIANSGGSLGIQPQSLTNFVDPREMKPGHGANWLTGSARLAGANQLILSERLFA
jgi:hypothetical protein